MEVSFSMGLGNDFEIPLSMDSTIKMLSMSFSTLNSIQ